MNRGTLTIENYYYVMKHKSKNCIVGVQKYLRPGSHRQHTHISKTTIENHTRDVISKRYRNAVPETEKFQRVLCMNTKKKRKKKEGRRRMKAKSCSTICLVNIVTVSNQIKMDKSLLPTQNQLPRDKSRSKKHVQYENTRRNHAAAHDVSI